MAVSDGSFLLPGNTADNLNSYAANPTSVSTEDNENIAQFEVQQELYPLQVFSGREGRIEG